MPTPDIDNLSEQIDVLDQLPTADQVPENLTPDQASETLTTGSDNPQPQIEQKATNLIEVLNRLQNITVENFFAANPTDDEVIAEQRTYFREGLTIDTEADNLITAQAKLYAMNTFIGLDTEGIAKVYGLPIDEYGEKVRYKPQVTIKFIEAEINQEDTPVRSTKLVKQISFRLFGEYIPKSRDDLGTLRQKIIDAFSGFSYLVSKENTYTYRDLDKGYRLAIDAEKEVFTELVTKVLSIQDDTYDERYVGKGDVNRPEIPQTADVLGQTKTLPFRGRWGSVYFWKAEYKQLGIEDKILADNFPLEFQ